MTVYVDPLARHIASGTRARWLGAKHDHLWCHLLADSPEELIAFALKLGMKREWLQEDGAGGHFDLIPPRRASAVKLGAREVSTRDLVRIRQRNRAALKQQNGASNG